MIRIKAPPLRCSRMAAWSLLLFTACLLPAVAVADSTTGTALTVTGTPTPGKQVTANVVVTGKHLVYGPPHSPVSVPGGAVQISVNGTIVLAVQATGGINSNVIDSGCVKPGSYPGTCDIAKYISDNTTFSALITLPKGASQYTISAKYTGDDDSHASTSQNTVLTAVYPGIDAAMDLLLND
ncbi:hypothetical protein C8J98_104223 [Luteibacter sp. OK325]|uniref:hypothetical protein n=1 Tax=Luteibacter sp. OK325 TaxID=2135670 RepID=UPI000D3B9658|nr:hypothetical protein [Luteibacter sp. OK325]PTR33012.1 hypothetical protein C8J98_104223 [Luteibacter sp. OK325]